MLTYLSTRAVLGYLSTRKKCCTCIIRLSLSSSHWGARKGSSCGSCTHVRARITVRRWAPDWPLVANGGPTAREVDVRTPRQHSDSSRSFLVVSATGSAHGSGREHHPRNAKKRLVRSAPSSRPWKSFVTFVNGSPIMESAHVFYS